VWREYQKTTIKSDSDDDMDEEAWVLIYQEREGIVRGRSRTPLNQSIHYSQGE
jgi:hypothetical protein